MAGVNGERRVGAERVVVLGASGLVGRALLPALRVVAPHAEVLGTALTDAHPLPDGRAARRLDAHDPIQLANLLHDVRPTTVILGTRWPRDGDYTAEQRDRDVKLARRLAAWLEKTEGRLVLLSSSSVFSGATGRYGEDDPPDPDLRYGEAKLAMERQLVELRCPHLIARLGRVNGFRPGRETRFEQLWRGLRGGEALTLRGDVWMNPLGAPAAADAIARLWHARAEGVWHLAGAEDLTEAGYARRVAAAMGLASARIDEAPPSGAPLRLTLDPSRARRKLQAQGVTFPPPLEDDLRSILRDAPALR